ncbi:MAG: maleylacetoacetate isomerase [Steroidobacteraceae bacterium]|jgi:maleylacetoacetate isomerase/maleylpyruvate isomerase
MLTLYGYPLSSAAYRVRIALALKGVEVNTVNKQLRRGEHRHKDYLKINPQGFVPALALEDGTVLTQSLAIIEWLDESHPQPPLLPTEPCARARVRSLCQLIACDIHPLNNLRVLQYLESTVGLAQAGRDEWYRHWIAIGFTALEDALGRDASRGRFCFGDQPGMADVCLVPQLYNARRYSVDLTAYPRIVAIDAACRELPAFESAAPEKQV